VKIEGSANSCSSTDKFVYYSAWSRARRASSPGKRRGTQPHRHERPINAGGESPSSIADREKLPVFAPKVRMLIDFPVEAFRIRTWGG
jgi:hypothetical protein